MSATLPGLPIVESPGLPDGRVYIRSIHPRTLYVGTRPMTEVEYAGAIGRHIVREGMADILEWCGETVGPEPVKSGAGRAWIEGLRRATTPQVGATA